MRAGKLSDRIEIQSREISQDTFGDGLQVWSTVATRWGSIEQVSGREVWQANQLNPDVNVKITLRYYSGLTPRHRLVNGDRTFNIDSVIDIDGREHVCFCKEEV